MDVDRLKKIAGAVRTGGKGTVRRKKKAVHKATTTDDKRLQSTLKRLNVNTIPSIEEVMLIKEDTVTVFSNPKVQASIAANTYVVTGPSTERSVQEMLPSLLPHMQSPDDLQKFQAMMAQQQGGGGGGGGGPLPAGQAPGLTSVPEDDSDDDVPDLVETFPED